MPRNTNWSMRKYSIDKNRPKNLCQVYKIELFHVQKNEQIQKSVSQCFEKGNKTVRVDKNSATKCHNKEWEIVNERELFGYAVQPQSPISSFNQEQGGDFWGYEDQMNDKFYKWEQGQTNEDWVQC